MEQITQFSYVNFQDEIIYIGDPVICVVQGWQHKEYLQYGHLVGVRNGGAPIVQIVGQEKPSTLLRGRVIPAGNITEQMVGEIGRLIHAHG